MRNANEKDYGERDVDDDGDAEDKTNIHYKSAFSLLFFFWFRKCISYIIGFVFALCFIWCVESVSQRAYENATHIHSNGNKIRWLGRGSLNFGESHQHFYNDIQVWIK